MLRLAMVVMACSALVVGCGGGDSGGSEAQTVIDDADQRQAEDALLTLDDFPSGWTESGDDDSEEGEDVSEARASTTSSPISHS